MPYLETAEVLRHDCVGPGLYELEFLTHEISSAAAPGQFVHIHVRRAQSDRQQLEALAQPSPQPLLRRPFSISGIDNKVSGSMILLYKTRGVGTQLLAQVRPGDYLDVMGPLGRGFTLAKPHPKPQPDLLSQPPAPLPHVLLIGGGLGIAPLVFLALTLARAGQHVTVFYGANTACEMPAAMSRLQSTGAGERIQVFTTTLDGSAGLTGIVTDLLTAEPSAAELSGIDFIYTCGPEPMMEAVEQFAAARGIEGEMSLETTLACGVGACLGCARRLRASVGSEAVYAEVCKDGPVFSFGQVELSPVSCREE